MVRRTAITYALLVDAVEDVVEALAAGAGPRRWAPAGTGSRSAWSRPRTSLLLLVDHACADRRARGAKRHAQLKLFVTSCRLDDALEPDGAD